MFFIGPVSCLRRMCFFLRLYRRHIKCGEPQEVCTLVCTWVHACMHACEWNCYEPRLGHLHMQANTVNVYTTPSITRKGEKQSSQAKCRAGLCHTHTTFKWLESKTLLQTLIVWLKHVHQYGVLDSTFLYACSADIICCRPFPNDLNRQSQADTMHVFSSHPITWSSPEPTQIGSVPYAHHNT